jgi:hypothetical protein
MKEEKKCKLQVTICSVNSSSEFPPIFDKINYYETLLPHKKKELLGENLLSCTIYLTIQIIKF